MRSEPSTLDLLRRASEGNLMPAHRQAEVWRKIEDRIPEAVEGQVKRDKLRSLFIRGKAIFAGAGSILILAAIVVFAPRIVENAAYGKVTHNPMPKITEESFAGTGLEVHLMAKQPQDHFVSQSVVLKVTNPTMKMFKGHSRNINLAVISEKANASYERLSSSQTAGDPHFAATHNRWKNIPCYVVTTEGATEAIPVLGTKLSGPTLVQPKPQDTVIVDIVDATNGQILRKYQFSDVTN